ncbi:hypothetical protein [Algoriphagus sp.]|uniref:hypothetical protein n=1 Tax=Algoriphagus sp. TaxID=1872435 RepID=UPI0026184234|nr:hypothetical protein [Algoriphagus sp.]
MSSLLINLFLAGFAYVIVIYFVAMMTKNALKKDKPNGDDGDGGIENQKPPHIDLPPGVVWPGQGPIQKPVREPLEV